MPSLLYFYNMLPVIGAGDGFTDILIVPHPKGFRKVVEKVLQLRKGPLCEGAPAKRVGERPYLAAFYENVSPSVSFADSAPPLALRATSPASGESVSQREPLSSYTFTPAASSSTNCLATRGLRPPARRAKAWPLMNSWSLGICTPYCLASSSKMVS